MPINWTFTKAWLSMIMKTSPSPLHGFLFINYGRCVVAVSIVEL